jgi:hypothetical protein
MFLGDLSLMLQGVRMNPDVVSLEFVAGQPVSGQLVGVPAGEGLAHSSTSISSLPRSGLTHARSSAIRAITLVW